MLGDAISSVGVILAAILISLTGWEWLDPLVSVMIGGLIGVSAYRVTRSSLHILIEGVPAGISLPKVEKTIQQTKGVASVHDLHIWSICSGHVALSAHITLNNFQDNHTDLRDRIEAALLDQFGIEHTTLQFESEILRRDHQRRLKPRLKFHPSITILKVLENSSLFSIFLNLP